MAPSPTIVLITGANSGIGYATTAVIASQPNYHIIMTSRSPEKGSAALSSIRADPKIRSTVSNIQLDVTSTDSIASAVDTVKAEHGRVDVLINNAGVGSKSSNLKERLEDTFRANVFGPALVTEAFTPLLLASANPRLINVSSALGSFAWHEDKEEAMWPVYSASKSALNMLTKQDSKALGKQGVKVWCVCPGLVESNLRGEGRENVTMGGMAGKASVSGETILGIVEGRRDGDVGNFVHKDGVYAW